MLFQLMRVWGLKYIVNQHLYMNAYNNGYDRLQTRENRLIACHSVHEKKSVILLNL